MGSSDATALEMLKLLKCESVHDLISQTIPAHILDTNALEYNGAKIPDEAKTEEETLAHL